MNQVVLLLILGLVTLSSQQGDLLKKAKSAGNECKKAHNLDDAAVKNAMKPDANPDNNTKCFFKCVATKLEVIDGAGAINFNKIRETMSKFLAKAKVDAMVDGCQKVTGADACDTVYKVAKCAMSKSKS